MMQAAWDFVLHIVATAPPMFWPLVVGALISGAAYWRAGEWLPSTLSERDALRARGWIGFFAGAVPTWVLWALAEPTYVQRTYGAFAAVAVGLFAPLTFRIGAWLVNRLIPAAPKA